MNASMRFAPALTGLAIAAALVAPPPAAQAAPQVATALVLPAKAAAKPTIKVTGKYCPKYTSGSSSYSRKVNIPKSKKNGTKLCTITRADNTNGVLMKATTTIYKANNARLKIRQSVTAKASATHYAGDATYVITGTADSVRITGYSWYYLEGNANSHTYGSVPGKKFSDYARYYVTQVKTWYDASQGRNRTSVTGFLTSFKTISFKAVKQTS